MEFYYKCNLKLDDFAHMLDDPTECYKFYWFHDANLHRCTERKKERKFRELSFFSSIDYQIVIISKDNNVVFKAKKLQYPEANALSPTDNVPDVSDFQFPNPHPIPAIQ